jgi:hypothetical protein
MKCPPCGIDVSQKDGCCRVMDSRSTKAGIRRRRVCQCGEKWTTIEEIVSEKGRCGSPSIAGQGRLNSEREALAEFARRLVAQAEKLAERIEGEESPVPMLKGLRL